MIVRSAKLLNGSKAQYQAIDEAIRNVYWATPKHFSKVPVDGGEWKLPADKSVSAEVSSAVHIGRSVLSGILNLEMFIGLRPNIFDKCYAGMLNCEVERAIAVI